MRFPSLHTWHRIGYSIPMFTGFIIMFLATLSEFSRLTPRESHLSRRLL